MDGSSLCEKTRYVCGGKTQEILFKTQEKTHNKLTFGYGNEALKTCL